MSNSIFMLYIQVTHSYIQVTITTYDHLYTMLLGIIWYNVSYITRQFSGFLPRPENMLGGYPNLVIGANVFVDVNVWPRAMDLHGKCWNFCYILDVMSCGGFTAVHTHLAVFLNMTFPQHS